MRKLTILVLLLSVVINLGAQEFAEKEPQLVKVFSVGDSESSLGYQLVLSGSDSAGPTSFCFNSEGNLVVSDTINRRISIFNKDWLSIKTIKLSEIIGPTRLEVDSDGNFIGYYGTRAVQKLDSDGNILFFLYVAREDIAEDIRNDGFYVVDNMVLAYNRNNGGIIGFKDLTPDYKENNKKPTLNTQQVISELARSHPSVQIEKKESIIPVQRLQSSSNVPRRVTSGDEYIILKDGVLLSRDFNTIQQSRSTQSQMIKSTQLETMAEENGLFSLYNKYKEHPVKFYHGNDISGNAYWEFGAYMFVLDSSGVPIKAIELQRGFGRTTGFVLSKDGDIYYMHTTETGHYLYKYKRDW